MRARLATLTLLGVLQCIVGTVSAAQPRTWEIPVQQKRLDNGLTVLISEDHSSPTFGISVVYKVGFRLEPENRTGFAHLFEHMMFQGTPNAPKGTFDRIIEGGGGINNGSTRYDYTDYIASAPVSALEPILWLESDRMSGLDFSQENLKNQIDVVKEEIRVNVKNQPYGASMWIDIGSLAFDRWGNAHDGYGSFKDLEAATTQDVAAFHKTYYAPNNAVLSLAGDLDPEKTFALIQKYFGSIPAQPAPPPAQTQEELNTKERTLLQSDPFAQVPALVLAWKLPDPHSPDFMPLAVLGDLLAAGDASRLYQHLVKGEEMVLEIEGGLGWPLGDYLTVGGPTLLNLFLLYKPGVEPSAVEAAIQREVDTIARDGVTPAELERTKTKMLADFYSRLERMIDRADLLGVMQTVTGDAASINDVPKRISAVTSDDIRRGAANIAVPANRSVIDRRPSATTNEEEGKEGGKS